MTGIYPITVEGIYMLEQLEELPMESEGYEPSKAIEPIRVLIVEDDLEYEPIWKVVFQKINPEITYTWSTSAHEAEQLIKEAELDGKKWDLIISDIFLSGSRTGLDLWQDWGEPLENMILVSGVEYSKVLDYIGLHRAPPVYIQKPFFIEDCIEVVTEYLQGVHS